MFSSGCSREAGGKCCLNITNTFPTPVLQPVMVCVQRNMTSCHYTYITEYRPHLEMVCSDSYHKKCLISFYVNSISEKVMKCYEPLKKVCSPSEHAVKSEKICETYHETSCTSKYVEKRGAETVGHSSCIRVP